MLYICTYPDSEDTSVSLMSPLFSGRQAFKRPKRKDKKMAKEPCPVNRLHCENCGASSLCAPSRQDGRMNGESDYAGVRGDSSFSATLQDCGDQRSYGSCGGTLFYIALEKCHLMYFHVIC